MQHIAQAPRDAQTVPVNVQVIDMTPKALDLILPAYLPASDLTQRIARDADLEAFWPDGKRRIFYLRARGRLMQPTERLQDLGVVPYELLHILPEPPEPGVLERPPEYPPNKGYAGAGNLNVAAGLAVMLGWTGAWALALTVDQGWITGLFPGLGLSLICTSLARHLWGGLGSSVRIPITGFAMFVPLWLLTPVPTVVLMSTGWQQLAIAMGPAFIAGTIGIMLGWLAWYGAVEPLPKVTRREVEDAVANVTFPCGICGGTVTQDVKADCVFGCGRVFHVGCYQHKRALGDASKCAVCGYQPA
ncbi:MAG: hypothetical protein H6737_08010 [Alphaproteobacteria bacterium]|nr:hypothetical protein [Alphaproteobacteria bacterium]